jgi:putative colanic acid biosynthesis UDP-glucose lipid carrier transferase
MLTVSKNIINPVLVSLILVGCVWFYLGEFDEIYFSLLILSFLLVVQLTEGVDIESDNKSFWKKTVVCLVLEWFWVISLLLLTGFASKSTHYFSREVLFSWFLITPVVLVTAHLLLRFLLHRLSSAISDTSSAIIVGVNQVSIKLAYQFMSNPLPGMVCMVFFDDLLLERSAEKKQQHPETLLGDIKSVAKFVKTHCVKHVYITLSMSSNSRIVALLDDLHDTTASIYFVPDDKFLFDLIQADISSIKDIPIMAVRESPFIGINKMIKRISDVILLLFILLLIVPLMLLIAIGIKLSSHVVRCHSSSVAMC